MSKAQTQQEQELENLTQNNEILSLESLIVEGSELTIPVTFDYPTPKGVIKASAIIRPLTTTEWENAQNYAMKNKKDFILKILEKGLLNDNGEPLSFELLQKMPFGVASQLYIRIADASGVKQDKEEQYKFTKDLLGF